MCLILDDYGNISPTSLEYYVTMSLKISTSMPDNNTKNLEPYMITRKVPHGNT
jgi:hypothetical protein